MRNEEREACKRHDLLEFPKLHACGLNGGWTPPQFPFCNLRFVRCRLVWPSGRVVGLLSLLSGAPLFFEICRVHLWRNPGRRVPHPKSRPCKQDSTQHLQTTPDLCCPAPNIDLGSRNLCCVSGGAFSRTAMTHLDGSILPFWRNFAQIIHRVQNLHNKYI